MGLVPYKSQGELASPFFLLCEDTERGGAQQSAAQKGTLTITNHDGILTLDCQLSELRGIPSL